MASFSLEFSFWGQKSFSLTNQLFWLLGNIIVLGLSGTFGNIWWRFFYRFVKELFGFFYKQIKLQTQISLQLSIHLKRSLLICLKLLNIVTRSKRISGNLGLLFTGLLFIQLNRKLYILGGAEVWYIEHELFRLKRYFPIDYLALDAFGHLVAFLNTFNYIKKYPWKLPSDTCCLAWRFWQNYVLSSGT